ncbi:hypothetical protein [Sporolituus thermophilus]|uniref:Uncharacterized protein n=1 Tax=Sporolituus thermophilus DSM 23256 TaxID=1123285 RepID=A0A1G7PJ20_9FIRM|nr:hypothetical protein [Sporolituus thermophilus]SDF86296.1 hypothetical protein SAMN05660235_02980 [Sporolituus thermophilus DSM 23256]
MEKNEKYTIKNTCGYSDYVHHVMNDIANTVEMLRQVVKNIELIQADIDELEVENPEMASELRKVLAVGLEKVLNVR